VENGGGRCTKEGMNEGRKEGRKGRKGMKGKKGKE
jgi:hypothetical protein